MAVFFKAHAAYTVYYAYINSNIKTPRYLVYCPAEVRAGGERATLAPTQSKPGRRQVPVDRTAGRPTKVAVS
jgi:hypothetical protein